MVQILLSIKDFESMNSFENLIATSAFFFLCMWIIQGVAFTIYTVIFGSGKILGPYKYRVILGRHTMDVVSMIAFVVLGVESLNSFGGYQSFSSYLNSSGEVSGSTERVYAFSAAAQRLAVLQLAYECKNFCDAILHNDGIIFLLHHTATAFLAIFGLHPFLHIYCGFFFGVSEVSTAILCCLVCFDGERGIPPLARAMPILMKVLGVAFAVSFVIFRIILWPYVSYYFWIDCLEVIRNKTAHSVPVVWLYLIANIGLTILQFVWLGEIFKTAIKLFSGSGELVVERGSSTKSKPEEGTQGSATVPLKKGTKKSN